MIHCFNTEIAELYGINCAVVLQNLDMWVQHNKANDKNYHDGYYWTYNSTKAYKELFPYLTQRQIRTALDRLKDEGIILTANYNEMKYDRTLWYTITEKGDSILHRSQHHLTSKSNGSDLDVKPIPYINTDINPYINSIPSADGDTPLSSLEGDFESLWSTYPRKKGKSDILKSRKKLQEISKYKDDIAKAIDNYKAEIRREKTQERYILNGSTFFNGRWRDYLEGGEADEQTIRGVTYL